MGNGFHGQLLERARKAIEREELVTNKPPEKAQKIPKEKSKRKSRARKTLDI